MFILQKCSINYLTLVGLDSLYITIGFAPIERKFKKNGVEGERVFFPGMDGVSQPQSYSIKCYLYQYKLLCEQCINQTNRLRDLKTQDTSPTGQANALKLYFRDTFPYSNFDRWKSWRQNNFQVKIYGYLPSLEVYQSLYQTQFYTKIFFSQRLHSTKLKNFRGL